MNKAMIELAKLFGLNHERMPREVLAEEVCTLALEKIRASAVQIRAGQIQNDCMSSALQARNQQCDKLAAVLVKVNEFCQQRGIGKIGDSAAAALMQRHDELAAQVERLKHERDEALTLVIRYQRLLECAVRGEEFVVGDAIFIGIDTDLADEIEESFDESPKAALAALKAQWQAEIHRQYAEIAACDKPAKEPWNSGCGMAPDGGYECNCGQCE